MGWQTLWLREEESHFDEGPFLFLGQLLGWQK
jgi:hypothetical protein